MRRDILPDRPLELNNRYRMHRILVTALLGFVAACFAVVLVGELWKLPALSREARAWERGEACVDGGYTGHEDEGDLVVDARCQLADGSVRDVSATFYGLSVTDVPDELELRFDAASGSIASRQGYDLMAQRRTMVYSGLVALGVMFGVLALFGGLLLRKFLRLRKLARTGDEGELHIVRVKAVWRGKTVTQGRRVWWKQSPTARKTHKLSTYARKGLAWLDATSPRSLALVSPDGKHAMLLDANFEPLELTDEELARAKAKLEAAGGGHARGLEEIGQRVPPAQSA